MWTWGNNLYGQLGNGGPEESGEEFRPAAATVPGSSGAPLKAVSYTHLLIQLGPPFTVGTAGLDFLLEQHGTRLSRQSIC